MTDSLYRKKQKRAALACCLMAALGLLLGPYVSGLRLEKSLEDIFYNGESGNGIGVASDLSDRADCGVNLASVGSRYLESSLLSPLKNAAQGLRSAGSLREKAEANETLEREFRAVSSLLEAEDLSGKDEELVSSLVSMFDSCSYTMSHDGYNAEASGYNSAIKTFPGSLIFSLMGLETAPIFR